VTKLGRNDPCSCGSGKKYKRCCQSKIDAQTAGTLSAAASLAGLLRTAMEHHQAGRLPEAEAIYRRILQTAPNHADALHLLGLIRHQTGQFEAAVDLIGKAISAKPVAPMYYNLGVSLQALGNLEAAADNYRRALSIDPRNANALSNLGAALKLLGQLDAAEESFRKSLALRPHDANAHSNLGIVLQQQGKYGAAIESFRNALAVDADHAEAYNNLGNALRDREELDAAVTFLRKAIALKPDYAEAHNNLGNALQDQGKLDEAVASFRTALEIEPDYLVVPWNISMALLMQGQLNEGWAMHEWRLRQTERIAGYRGLPSVRPTFSGEDLAGKTILVWAEQGVGDEIFFAGVLPDVIRAAGRCVVECDPRLVPLYARSFPAAEIIPKLDPPHSRALEPDIDWQCAIGSLPRWFRTRIESFPLHHGYLVPDAKRVAFWKERLDALGPGRKVGITWRSKHRSVSRDLHYTELSQWGPILAVPGLTFVSLQYDDCRAELDAARQRFGVDIHSWDDLDQMNDLDEVAALMTALDLTIAPTTTPAIMAGAVGAKAWMLLTRHITWKTLGTECIPMFPDMRLVWRPRNVAWDVILEQVGADLRAGRMS
jgi:tetratricopeptide (TPR) repeat protein